MLNSSDILFIATSLFIVLLSYYFLIVKRKTDVVTLPPVQPPQQRHVAAGANQRNVIQEDSDGEGEEVKTKRDAIKDARKREKKAQKEVG